MNTTASSATPAATDAAATAQTPTTSATADAKAAAPAAATTTAPAADDTAASADTPTLLGKTYLRAHTPPVVLEKNWKRIVTMDLGTIVSEDFLLFASNDQLLAIVGTKGKHEHGQTYEYTVSDEMLLPKAVRDYQIARCSFQKGGRRSILAAFDPKKPHSPIWAITVSQSGKIQPMLSSEVATLVCIEKPRNY